MITAEQYFAAQALITARIVALMVRTVRIFGVPTTKRARRTLALAVFRDVDFARRQSYALAVRYMQFSANRAGEQLVPVPDIPPYSADAVEKVLERVTEPVVRAQAEPVAAEAARPQSARVVEDVSTLDQVTRRKSNVRVDYREPTSPQVVTAVGLNAGASVARHAQQAGRDAVQRTAEAQPERIGWARVLSGDENCAFCAMLASRGPVYGSSQSVGRVANKRFAGDGEFKFHDHCDCIAELVFKGKPWDGEADFERLEKLWMRSTKRKSGKAARKAFAAAYAAAQ